MFVRCVVFYDTVQVSNGATPAIIGGTVGAVGAVLLTLAICIASICLITWCVRKGRCSCQSLNKFEGTYGIVLRVCGWVEVCGGVCGCAWVCGCVGVGVCGCYYIRTIMLCQCDYPISCLI